MIPSVSTKIDSRTVIGSGSYVVSDTQEIVVVLTGSQEVLKFRFVFRSVENAEGSYPASINFEVLNPQEGRITFINFLNPLGAGSQLVEPIANLDSKPLYLTYFIHSVGNLRVFNYTFAHEAGE